MRTRHHLKAMPDQHELMRPVRRRRTHFTARLYVNLQASYRARKIPALGGRTMNEPVKRRMPFVYYARPRASYVNTEHVRDKHVLGRPRRGGKALARLIAPASVPTIGIASPQNRRYLCAGKSQKLRAERVGKLGISRFR